MPTVRRVPRQHLRFDKYFGFFLSGWAQDPLDKEVPPGIRALGGSCNDWLSDGVGARRRRRTRSKDFAFPLHTTAWLLPGMSRTLA